MEQIEDETSIDSNSNSNSNSNTYFSDQSQKIQIENSNIHEFQNQNNNNNNNHQKLQLYDYQREAIDVLKENINNISRGQNRLLVVFPTGAGKSVVIAKFVEEIYKEKNWQILIFIDVQELVQQNYNALEKWWTDEPVEIGICCSGLNRKNFDEQIIVGSIQTMASKKNIGKREILIVDEAHKIKRNNNGRYGKFIHQLQKLNPNLIIIGFTATPFRTDSGLLTEFYEKQRPIFDKLVYQVEVDSLIKKGILSPSKIPKTRTALNLKGVKANQNDFILGSLDKKVNQSKINQKIVSEIINYGQKYYKRKSWLIFACTIDHANRLAELLEEKSISVGVIVSDTKVTSTQDRKKIIKQFQNFEIQALVNVNVLTTGFDHPGIDMIALVRPTKSRILHVQMLGRGMRTFQGKSNCLILDFAQNIARNGFIRDVDGRIKERNIKRQKKKNRKATKSKQKGATSEYMESELTPQPANDQILRKRKNFDPKSRQQQQQSKNQNHGLGVHKICSMVFRNISK